SNDLKVDDVTIRAILNHSDVSALGHYCFKSFDSLADPIQRYADWLWGVHDSTAMSRKPVSIRPAAPRVVQPAPRHAPHAPVIAPPAYTPQPMHMPIRQSGMRPLMGRERQ